MSWASTPNRSGAALLLGNYIYVTTHNYSGGAQRVNITNQTSTNFINITDTWTVATYNNNIYFSQIFGPNIYVTDTNGTLLQTITLSRNIMGIAIYGDFLYALSYGGSNQIIKYNLLTNTSDNTWGTSTFGSVNTVDAWNVTVYNNIMYISNRGNNTISKLNLSTNTAVWSWVSVTDPLNTLVYGDYLYVASYSGGAVYKIDLTAGSPSAVNIYSLVGASCPIQLNGYLYVLRYNGGSIFQTNIIMPGPTHITCFLGDSNILTVNGYRPIQDLRNGDLVKTLNHGFLPISMIGRKEIHHVASNERIKDQLYKCTSSNFPEVFEDLVITGSHSILVEEFCSEEQRNKIIELYDEIYITDDKYRLPACVDERTVVYEKEGNYMIYHLALENEDYYSNYGIYANGLLVETCSKRYLKELSNMELI